MSGELNTLTVIEKITLAALLVIAPPDGRPFTRNAIGAYTFTPSKVLADQFLFQLIDKGIVHTETMTAGVSTTQPGFLSPDVKLRLAIKNDRECFENLIEGLNLKQHASTRNVDVEELLAQVLIDECMMFLTELSSLDISDYKNCDAIYRYLVEILSQRSIPETFMLLWRAVNDSDPIEDRFYYLKGDGGANLERFIQKAYQFHLEYKDSGKRIRPFMKKGKGQTSSITLLLMEELFGIGASYYRHPVPLLSQRPERVIEYLSEDEKVFLSDRVPKWLVKEC